MVIVKSGCWLYAGEVMKPVDIIGMPHDFWYELAAADDQLEPGETPSPLGEDGLLYYVRFGRAGEVKQFTWPDSTGYPTIAAAMRVAETRAPTPIDWA